MTNLTSGSNQPVSLCEALDRLLSTGVVALGELKISVADVDLIYVGLQLVVSSVESGRDLGSMIAAGPSLDSGARKRPSGRPLAETSGGVPAGRPPAVLLVPPSAPVVEPAGIVPIFEEPREPATARNAGQSPDKNGLGKLVLTLVKLLHQLLQLQALRRMEAGSLTDLEIEELGTTLMRQAQEIKRMAKEFGLQPEDLNLDLGPLGKLM